MTTCATLCAISVVTSYQSILLVQASKAALALFKFGQQEAAERGLILVDTKYEFGKDAEGNIMLIDEIHTPDSSR